MRRTAPFPWVIFLVALIGLNLLGCATGPTATTPTKSMAELLQEAGFKAYQVGTSQEKVYLQSCPQDTLMVHKRAGATCYAFPAPASGTMYIGDEKAYWRLQDLLDQQEQKIKERQMESDPEFWQMWGTRGVGG